jgi:Big-like domain-containing protein/IPT/TIG domain-containing protein/putative Ig domain-containing protein/VCBS repeat protein
MRMRAVERLLTTAVALRGLLFGRHLLVSGPRQISDTTRARPLRNANLFVVAIAGLLFAGAGQALASAGCSALTGNFTAGPSYTGTSQASGFNAGDTINFTVNNPGNAGSYYWLEDTTTNTNLTGNLDSSSSYTFPASTSDTVSVLVNNTGVLDVSWSCTANPLTLTPHPSALTQVGQTYSQANIPQFGTAPYTYSVSAGAVPAGTTLNSSTGTVSGIPTAPGAFSYTIEVTDSSSPAQTATATTNGTIGKDSTITSVVSSLNPSDFNQLVTFTATVTGFSPTGSVTFSFDGSPQAPVTLSSGQATFSTSSLSAGSHTITASYGGDTSNANSSGSLSGNQTVNSVLTATQAIASKALTVNQAATPFAPVTGSGGTGALTYSVLPSLPTGLSISSSTGAISGTATVTHAASSFTVTVTDANGVTASNSFSLIVNSAVTATSVIPSPTLTLGHASPFTPVTGANGTPPLTYSVSPPLLASLSMAPSTGTISGTPTISSAATPYTVTVTDANGATATAGFNLTVNSALTANLVIPSQSLSQNHAAAPFTPVIGTNGTPPLSYSVSPALPGGLAIASSTGAISGTPTVTSPTTNYTVTVTDADGATATATFGLTVNTGPPTVTSVSPNSGPASGGTLVTVSGTNFTGATAVNFGSAPAASFTVNSATSITATSAAGSAGAVDVTVTNTGGTSTTSVADGFTYVSSTAPTVTGISPNAGPPSGGTRVIITGSQFTGATAVNFGSVAASSFTVVSATQITVTSPPENAGTVDVTLTTPGGTSIISAADHFTYTTLPSVGAVSPNAGPTTGGTVVTISGANFIGATGVNFGSVPATFAVNSATQITASSPPEGAGTVDVTVTAPNGTSPTSPADQFAYESPPVVTTISPGTGPTLGGTIVTISGTSFTGATAVKFGNAAATSFTVNSPTAITVAAPNGIGTVDVTVTTLVGTSATSAADQFSYEPSHDFNGDGKSDVLWGDASNNSGIWLMNGASILQSKVLGTVPSNWAVVGQRDFNGDGKGDLLWRDNSGDIGMWFMNGTQIASTAMIGGVPITWSVAATGDFNADGKGDIVWRDTSGNVELWLMNGATIMQTATLGNVPLNWAILGADMKGEIFWRNLSTGDVGIWVMNGTTIAKTVDFGAVPLNWTVAGLGDFDGNGSTDLLWRDASGNVGVWLMNGTSIMSSAVVGQMSLGWSVAETGDYNGNAKSDILWTDGSGDVQIWFMNGASISSTATLGNVGTSWTVQSLSAD